MNQEPYGVRATRRRFGCLRSMPQHTYLTKLSPPPQALTRNTWRYPDVHAICRENHPAPG